MNIQDTRANKELLLTFFLAFARFEYALKASGFFKIRNENEYDARCPPVAEPNWDTFAVSLRDIYEIDRTEGLEHACHYLLDCPPDKQVLIRVSSLWKVAWETPVRPESETDIEFILRMVRTVRNNLFHGGKHNNIEVHEDTERTEQLLQCSLVVLEECLELSPEVRRQFDEANL